jgi:hypothetical protein
MTRSRHHGPGISSYADISFFYRSPAATGRDAHIPARQSTDPGPPFARDSVTMSGGRERGMSTRSLRRVKGSEGSCTSVAYNYFG